MKLKAQTKRLRTQLDELFEVRPDIYVFLINNGVSEKIAEEAHGILINFSLNRVQALKKQIIESISTFEIHLDTRLQKMRDVLDETINALD